MSENIGRWKNCKRRLGQEDIQRRFGYWQLHREASAQETVTIAAGTRHHRLAVIGQQSRRKLRSLTLGWCFLARLLNHLCQHLPGDLGLHASRGTVPHHPADKEHQLAGGVRSALRVVSDEAF